VFLFRQFFLTIPSEVEEAAKIDGLRPMSIFLRISAPLAKPAFAASAILTFIGSWNNFIWPLFDVQTINMYTLPLALNFFKGANGTQIYWNQMMMATLISLIPTFVIYIIFERYFVTGLSAVSGIKG
jgi:multiple sugar transport system permease protein